MTATQTRSRFLDLRALTALEHMRFVTRQRIEGAYTGRHQSRQQGGAGEFVDFREYSEGEDLRRLDWKVLGRTGRAYVRLYQDETNLPCTLALDASGSMLFGGASDSAPRGSKLEYAQYLATALSHVIIRGQDQAGLALLTDELLEHIPPGGTIRHEMHVQERIENLATRPTRTMGPALKELFERVSRRGVLLVISDYLMEDVEEVFAAVRLFRHRQWEVVVLHLVHPGEERLPEGTAFRFVGLEDDGYVNCSPLEVRRVYEEGFDNHLAMVRTLSLAAGCDYRRVSTAVPYLRTLGGFLVERSG
jgi:uncharacterized protein (DUF58 family)